MRNIFIALLIGLAAAVIDVTPMLLQKLDLTSCISAFIQWIVLGLIIPSINWKMAAWLKGLLVAELAALPILVLVFEKDPTSILPILLFSAVLGAGVGAASGRFIQPVQA